MQVVMRENGLIELVSETDEEFTLLQRFWINGIDIIEYDNEELYQSVTIKEREE